MRPQRYLLPVLAVALAACARDAKPSSQESPAPSATGTTPPVVTTPPKPTAVATKPPIVLKTDLADGKHYAYLKTFDTAKLQLTLDVVQFLTGEEAEKAAQEDGQEAFDYYVRNQNKKLRTLTVSAGAKVVVNTLTASETGSSSKDKEITLAKLKSYFDKGQAQQRVFYVTLSKGVIVKINEQYLP
jgi:hypothetical protein